MRTFLELHQAALPGPTFVTIGNFDGLHLGHQALLIRARELAAEHPSGDAQTAMVTFDPHPITVLRPERTLLKLTTPYERLTLAAALGVELGVIHPFTRHTAQLSARDFVRLLKEHLGMAGLVVGPDFALGRNRSGDIPTLRALGEEMGYLVEIVEPVEWDGRPARSSVIRDLIARGDVAEAATLLGRYYPLTGPVQQGDQRGRRIGIPTANVGYAPDKLLPANGVYATIVRICTTAVAWAFPAVTNVGVRPTVDGLHHRVEAHLLDFPPAELPDDLYGQTLTVEFVERLRGEQRFEGIQQLVAQIHKDIDSARALFARITLFA